MRSAAIWCVLALSLASFAARADTKVVTKERVLQEIKSLGEGASDSAKNLLAAELLRSAAAPPTASVIDEDNLPDLASALPVAKYSEILKYTQVCGDVLRQGRISGCSAYYEFCADPIQSSDLPDLTALELVAKGTCPVTKDVLANIGGDRAGVMAAGGLFGASWQEDVIRGIAAFLASRAKAEALDSVVEHLRKSVCAEEKAKQLFSSTCTSIGVSRPDEVPLAWGVVKSAIEADLNRLPYSMPRTLLPTDKPEEKDRREVLIASAETMRLVLVRGEDPVLVLSGLVDRYGSVGGTCGRKPAQCTLLVAGLVARLLEPGLHAVTALPADSWARYFAIMERWYLPDALAQAGLFEKPNSTDAYRGRALKLSRSLSSLRTVVSRMRAKADSPKDENPEARLDRLFVFTQAIGAFFELPQVLEAVDIKLDPQRTEEFGRAVEAGRALVDALDGVRRKDYASVFNAVLRAITHMPGTSIPPWMQKYGGFLTDVASAQNPDEVQRALEAAASPVGSWRHKRAEHHFSLTINGYVGLQGGGESFSNVALSRAVAARASLLGSVGVEAALGLADGWSIGLFASIIDVGALLDFRIGDVKATNQMDGTAVAVDQTPTFGFAQVFSPGGYFVVGIPSVPLVLGLGGGLSPQLRRVTFTSSNTTTDVSTWRFGVFLAVDVTIFEL